ncbi:DNA-directed RNA polymerase subunit N [Candidatus Aenigmatarchaeota archaeon]
MIPIRCMTCGKPLAGLWEKFKERRTKGEDTKKILDSLGLDRYCCRALFLTHKDVFPETTKFHV